MDMVFLIAICIYVFVWLNLLFAFLFSQFFVLFYVCTLYHQSTSQHSQSRAFAIQYDIFLAIVQDILSPQALFGSASGG